MMPEIMTATAKQREAHGALIKECVRAGCIASKHDPYCCWPTCGCEKMAVTTVAILSLIAERLSDVTEEMECEGKEFLPVTPSRRADSAADVFRAMLGASALFEGDRE